MSEEIIPIISSYLGEQTAYGLKDIRKPRKKIYKLNNYIPMLVGLCKYLSRKRKIQRQYVFYWIAELHASDYIRGAILSKLSNNVR